MLLGEGIQFGDVGGFLFILRKGGVVDGAQRLACGGGEGRVVGVELVLVEGVG